MASPIPSPEEFAKYKQVMADMPERILRQFEEDSKNNRELMAKALHSDSEFDKRSQYMAFAIIMAGITATFLLAYMDKNAAALCTGLGTVAAIFGGTFARKR